jgi:hypothetical protein
MFCHLSKGKNAFLMETYIAGGHAVLAGDTDDVLVDHGWVLYGACQVRYGIGVHAPAHKNKIFLRRT